MPPKYFRDFNLRLGEPLYVVPKEDINADPVQCLNDTIKELKPLKVVEDSTFWPETAPMDLGEIEKPWMSMLESEISCQIPASAMKPLWVGMDFASQPVCDANVVLLHNIGEIIRPRNVKPHKRYKHRWLKKWARRFGFREVEVKRLLGKCIVTAEQRYDKDGMQLYNDITITPKE